MIPAPTKQWAMLQMALADFDVVSKDPHYHIAMNKWHEPRYKTDEHNDAVFDFCYVCLAGAVMARTLEVPKQAITYPRRFVSSWDRVLYRLDLLRSGCYLNDHQFMEYTITRYDEDAAQWRIDMEHFMEYLMLFDL